MMFEKICLICLFIQDNISDRSILTGPSIEFYGTEGSTINIIPKNNRIETWLEKRHKNGYGSRRVNISKYDIVTRPSVIEFQIVNVTAGDQGIYWFRRRYFSIAGYSFNLNITSISAPSHPYLVYAIVGSSPMIKYSLNLRVYHSPFDFQEYPIDKSRIVRNITIHADLQMYNVTLEDEGCYEIDLLFRVETTKLQLAKLWFINQTNLKTIEGQEGEAIYIICGSTTEQFITALTLESNGTIKAIGNNQTVSYSFIPDRTDHLTKYQCVDSKHLSIMLEVELRIRYAPEVTVHYTNGAIECDCDGIPPIYSVYRLDRISEYGELVRSVNLDNETFVFHMDQFPYQRNGRYMCVVSNGTPDTNGQDLQNSSIPVNYEGPPVFAKENRLVKIGKVGQSSIRMSFYVYSYPDIEEIFLQKLGRMRGKKRKMSNYVLKSTLLYNELDNTTGVPGYDILIESNELDVDDFQGYIITVKNRLGASDFQFEIIKKEDHAKDQRERKNVFTICIVGAVLFGSIIVNVCFCVKRLRRSDEMHSNVNVDHTYHTYDEIGTISYGVVSNVRPSHTNDNQVQNLTQQHAATILNEANVQSTDNDSNELSTDFPNDDLPQLGVPDVREQLVSISTDDTNIIDDRQQHEQSSDQKSQTSDDSDSESSQTLMVGNVGDGYENPYQTVLQDHQESHQYTKITIERNTSVSSAESNCEMQILEKSLPKEAGYINLQF